MNRRQEVALWIFGLAVASTAFVFGEEGRSWLLGIFVPLATVGSLTVFSLRTRDPNASPSAPNAARPLKTGVALVLAAIGLHHLSGALDQTIDLSSIEADVAGIDDVRSEVSELTSSVNRLALDVDQVNATVRAYCR